MSRRIGKERIPLWIVCAHGRAGWKLFAGSLHEAVAYINRLHRESGIQHSAREVGQDKEPGASTRFPRLNAIALGIGAWLNDAEPWFLTVT